MKKKHYILIDVENVQPKRLPAWGIHDVQIMVFVGASQARLPMELVTALQPLGDKVHYVKASGHGSNALDFHIAFYLGELARTQSAAVFHVVSRDTGFDPLIHHLKERGIAVERSASLDELPFLNGARGSGIDDKVHLVLKNLAPRGPAKPRKLKTLQSTIRSLFPNRLADGELEQIIAQMQKRKWITVENERLIYSLPQLPTA